MNITSLLSFWALALFMLPCQLLAQSSYSLSIDKKNDIATLLLTHIPDFYEITYFIDRYSDIKVNCSLTFDYRIQSVRKDGTRSTWYDEKASLTLELKKIDQGGGIQSLSEISNKLSTARSAFYQKYPGLNEVLKVTELALNEEATECFMNRNTIEEVCEDFFDTRGLLNQAERSLMNAIKSNPNLAFSEANDCADFSDAVEDTETLNLSRRGLSKLSLLTFFPQLIKLDLSHNPDVELSALKKIRTLRYLNLNNSGIEDASDLGSLRGMLELSLNFNSLSSSSFLKTMLNLEKLEVANNKIMDLSGLTSRGLKHLVARENAIEDISFLSSRENLTILDLSRNKIRNIAPLKNLLFLSSVDISSNFIMDFSPLKKITALRSLNIDDNLIHQSTSFNPALCPIQSTTYKLSDLDSEVRSELSHLNDPKYRFIVLGNDQLSLKCDEVARKVDKDYRTYQVVVPEPTEDRNQNNGGGCIICNSL